ncbi:unnamed protein product [Musa hybrid cultivar]
MRPLHHQVRERGSLQCPPRRHHLPGPDRRPLRRLRPGPLPPVPLLAIGLDDNASGIIHFDVGVVNKRLPLSLFEFPPDCTPSPLPLSTNSIKMLIERLLLEMEDCIRSTVFLSQCKMDRSKELDQTRRHTARRRRWPGPAWREETGEKVK